MTSSSATLRRAADRVRVRQLGRRVVGHQQLRRVGVDSPTGPVELVAPPIRCAARSYEARPVPASASTRARCGRSSPSKPRTAAAAHRLAAGCRAPVAVRTGCVVLGASRTGDRSWNSDDARLLRWIGKSETGRDWIAPDRARALQATLDRMHPLLAAGDPLPPLWHWLYFWTDRAEIGTGRDGHPALGGFLPPVGTARRMWAGSRVSVSRAPDDRGSRGEDLDHCRRDREDGPHRPIGVRDRPSRDYRSRRARRHR